VLYAAISRDDLLILQGKTTHDYFGVEVVGRISAIGEAVGTRKIGEVVGVFH
jgi:D-arabinose 1-dehydrogenase-like Zn-dependent alcohol dehydrogenase